MSDGFYDLAAILGALAAAALLIVRFRIASIRKKVLDSLPFTISRKAELSDSERQQLLGWSEDPFRVNSLGLTWSAKDEHFTLFEKGVAASRVSLLRYKVAGLTIAGIGGVVTAPPFRGKGYASVLLELALDQARNQYGADFGVLFCLPDLEKFYADRGFARARIVTDARLVPMFKQLGRRHWPDETLEMGPW